MISDNACLHEISLQYTCTKFEYL